MLCQLAQEVLIEIHESFPRSARSRLNHLAVLMTEIDTQAATEPLELRAWQVWEDAIEAIRRLDERTFNEPNTNWRVDFVAAVTLLRAIGHILHHFDREVSQEHKRRIDHRWPGMKSDPIFKWLDDARGDAIKVYELGADLMKGWQWTGSARRPEDAPDAELTGMLFLSEFRRAGRRQASRGVGVVG